MVRTFAECIKIEAMAPDENAESAIPERKLTFVETNRKYVFTCCDYEPAVLGKPNSWNTSVASGPLDERVPFQLQSHERTY